MDVCVLAGGVGSGRFCAGLARVVDPTDLTIVVNTGDDERVRGLHISPDVDTVLYHLAGLTDWDRGWGVSDESHATQDRYRELVEQLGDVDADLQEWFILGDRDLATHQLRTRLLDAGWPLSRATDALRRALGVAPRVLPMSDEAVRTVITTRAGERLDFQTYFVRRRHADEVVAIEFTGAAEARPAPGVPEAIDRAALVLLPPSNPLVSIDPILAVPGIREALESSTATRVAVSPIVGGRAVKGPAEGLLRSLGHDVSASGVARLYQGLVDCYVLDDADASQATAVEDLGMRPIVCDTIMSGPEEAARIAKAVMARVGER